MPRKAWSPVNPWRRTPCDAPSIRRYTLGCRCPGCIASRSVARSAKCYREEENPVECPTCGWWLRNEHGLKVHVGMRHETKAK